MAVDEYRNRRGQGITGKIEAAQNFARDILRGVLGPMVDAVESDDADWVAVLAGHQVANDSFEIGFADISFRECGTRLPVIVDDAIKSLIVTLRHSPRVPAGPAHQRNSQQHDTGEVKHETGATEPQSIAADAVALGAQNVAGTTAKSPG